MFEGFLAGLMPLLAGYVDQSLPTPGKRLLYMNLCALEDEGLAKLAETQTSLDDAAFKALVAEAKQEFTEAGHGEVPQILNQFVAFSF